MNNDPAASSSPISPVNIAYIAKQIIFLCFRNSCSNKLFYFLRRESEKVRPDPNYCARICIRTLVCTRYFSAIDKRTKIILKIIKNCFNGVFQDFDICRLRPDPGPENTKLK